jgi:hypothetical protein
MRSRVTFSQKATTDGELSFFQRIVAAVSKQLEQFRRKSNPKAEWIQAIEGPCIHVRNIRWKDCSVP